MKKKPILYVLGVEGQFYLSKALSVEFDRPIAGLLSNSRIQESLTPEIEAIFDHIYSLPDFYLEQVPLLKKMTREELDFEQTNLEKKLGISNINRSTYADRAIRWSDDYLRIRYWQISTLRFIDMVTSEVDAAFFMDGVAHFLQLSLRSYCHKNNIPYLMTQTSRVTGRFHLLHEDGKFIGIEKTFEQLQKEEKVLEEKDKKYADEQFENFITNPTRPIYTERNTTAKFNWKRIKKNLSYTLSSKRIFPSKKIQETDRVLNYEANSFVSLVRGVRRNFRKIEQDLYGVFDKTPDLNVPYIYLPLHYTPEVSDMYFGSAYEHHAAFITHMAKNIPAYTQLYVKDHTSMLGRRPTAFYKEISSLYNVRVISPLVDTFTLIENAIATATVTGTAGWEAYLLNKPVIVFGNTFYNFFPGVFHAPLDENFKKDFDSYFESFSPSTKERKNAYRAFYASTYDGVKGDIGNDITMKDVPENAVKFAKGIRQCIERWEHEIKGGFPLDLKVETHEKKKQHSA